MEAYVPVLMTRARVLSYQDFCCKMNDVPNMCLSRIFRVWSLRSQIRCAYSRASSGLLGKKRVIDRRVLVGKVVVVDAVVVVVVVSRPLSKRRSPLQPVPIIFFFNRVSPLKSAPAFFFRVAVGAGRQPRRQHKEPLYWSNPVFWLWFAKQET